MSERVIIYTRPEDRGVDVITPSPRLLHEMEHGVVLSRAMRGYDIAPLDREWEATKLLRCPVWRRDWDDKRRRDLAYTWFEAMIQGGVGLDDAFALVRDRSMEPHAMAPDIIFRDELPERDAFRNAWRRSLNGGPVYVDEEAAHAIRVDLEVRRMRDELAERRDARLRRIAERRLVN